MNKHKYTFCVRHYFGLCYVPTTQLLEDAYKPMISWLTENCQSYDTMPMDNAAYSDVNEDPWTGYHIHFDDESEAMAFKLKWWRDDTTITCFKDLKND